ncbi:MAG: lysoplasmalogenase [Burkholderiales bacterium]|nr:lysoplasmalogenase [Anaerolineae bacterium]
MNLTLASHERTWLLALLILWAGLLFGGFLLGSASLDNSHRMPTWTRMGSSLTLSVAAWSWWLFTRQNEDGGFALFIAIGMTLGFIGDLFMAELLIKGENHILAGIAAFGLGHVAYIIGLVRYSNHAELTGSASRWGALLVWLIVGAVLWFVVVYRGSNEPSTLHYAALPYALLLAGTTGIATGLALQEKAFIPMAIGAALFLFSDLLLAAQLFNGANFPFINDVVWLLYGPGQMLIVFGARWSLLP